MPYTQKNERELVLACQQRDIAAFEELVKRNQQLILNLFFQLKPEYDNVKLTSLAEEVFVRVWRTVNELRNLASFQTFLVQTTIDVFNEDTRSPDSSKQPDSPSNTSIDPPSEILKESELLIKWAMKQLPQNLRTPLVLRELGNMGYEEIALITRFEIGSIKSQIAQARNELHKLLKPHFETNTINQTGN